MKVKSLYSCIFVTKSPDDSSGYYLILALNKQNRNLSLPEFCCHNSFKSCKRDLLTALCPWNAEKAKHYGYLKSSLKKKRKKKAALWSSSVLWRNLEGTWKNTASPSAALDDAESFKLSCLRILSTDFERDPAGTEQMWRTKKARRKRAESFAMKRA